MAIATVLLGTTLLAMAPSWAIIDLPYPEVAGGEIAAPPLDARLAEAVTSYARTRAPATRPEISPLQVDPGVARLRLVFGDRSEIVVLVKVKNEWKVVEVKPY